MKPPIIISDLNPIYDIDIRPATTYQPSYFFGSRKLYNNIDFDVTLNNGTNLQRDFVWNLKQKQDLIIGMLCDMTIPQFYAVLYTDDFGDKREIIFKIIDGKQRLSTIGDFINGKFGIPYNGDIYFFDELTDMQKYTINTYSLDFRIVYEYPDALLGDEVYVKIFNFVNFGGTPQEKEHMEKLEKSLLK